MYILLALTQKSMREDVKYMHLPVTMPLPLFIPVIM